MPKQEASLDMSIVAENIRNRRKEIGMTQVQLASAAQLGENTIQRLESGQCQATIESYFRVSKALKTTPNNLAPTSYGFSAENAPFATIEPKYAQLNKADKAFFIKAMETLLDGLLRNHSDNAK